MAIVAAPGVFVTVALGTSDPSGVPLLTSSAALGALVMGIPAAVAVLAAIWARPGGRVLPQAAATLALAAIAVGGTALALRGRPTTAPAAPAAGPAMPAATCSPDGRVLRLTATGFTFDEDCLAAPTGEAVRIVFDNQDEGVPHNVAIYADPGATRQLFAGEEVTGPATVTYRVPPLEAGTYLFRCDFHPQQMQGAFVVA
jgi:plastocyanin